MSTAMRSAALLLLIPLGVLLWVMLRSPETNTGEGIQPIPAESSSRDPTSLAPVSEDSRGDRVTHDAQPPSPEDGPVRGSVRVALRLESGEPVRRGSLELHGGRAWRGEVDSRGEVVFDDLPEGAYWPIVDADSLPTGYAPPGLQSTESPADLPGFFRTEVVITADAPHQEVTLVVSKGGLVHGYVRDNTGRGVAGVEIRCQATTPGLEGFAFDTRSDDDGYYVIDRVRPGAYWIELFVTDDDLRSLARPAPHEFELFGGESLNKDLLLGAGDCRVEGVVVDQDGRPFPALVVLAYYTKALGSEGPRLSRNNQAARTTTDSNGRYVFDGIYATEAPVQLGIQVAPDGYYSGREVGANLLGARVERIAIDLRPGQSIQARTVVAHRSRPFHLDGRIELPEGASLAGLRVFIIHPPPRIPEGVETPNGVIVRRDQPRIEEDGTFEWSCETPRDPFTLQVVRGSAKYEEELLPIPGETLFLSVPFPTAPN